MRLTWFLCGCLWVVSPNCPLTPPAWWCEQHRCDRGAQFTANHGCVVLDLATGRYEWLPLWAPVPGLKLEGHISPDGHLVGEEIGRVAGAILRPIGGRRVVRLFGG